MQFKWIMYDHMHEEIDDEIQMFECLTYKHWQIHIQIQSDYINPYNYIAILKRWISTKIINPEHHPGPCGETSSGSQKQTTWALSQPGSGGKVSKGKSHQCQFEITSWWKYGKHVLQWRFPEMGVPPVLIHFHRIFHEINHPTIGVPPF